jgi:putative membrane protein
MNMKKQTKWITGLLCSVLAISAWGYTTIQGQEDEDKTTETENEKTITSAISNENIDLNNASTVYVMSGADGSVNKVMASEDVLKNLSTQTSGTSQVSVTDIDGKSVDYKGNVEKDLPVDMKVTYKLDGKSISANDLAGKSGKVKITYSFTSKHSYDDVQVPFLTLTGMILEDNVFSNVSISNGKLITASGKNIVVGIAFPGLSSVLDTNNLPEEFSIEADVTNFELSNTLTYVSDSLLNSEDIDTKDAEDLVAELTDGIDSLIDGSSQLYEGMNTLMESTETFSSGIDQLVSGAGSLSSGTNELLSGAASLQSGASTLSGGLNELASNNSALVAAAGQIFNALIDQSNSTLSQKLEGTDISIDELSSSNYNDVLDGLLEQMDADAVHDQATEVALEQVTAKVEENSEVIEQQVTAAVQQQVEAQVNEKVKAAVQRQVEAQVKAQVLASQNITEEIYNSLPEENKAAIDQAIASNTQGQMQSDAVQATISAKVKENTEAQMGTNEIIATITQNVEATKQQLIQTNLYSDEVQQQIAAAVSKVSASASQVSSLKGSLNSYQTFYNALVAYTNGVSSAATGAAALSSGMNTLYNGTVSLNDGALQLESGLITLQDGTAALTSGISQLQDGSMQLSEGITDAFSDIPDLEEKLDDVKDAIEKYNKDYTSYKFIYKTDEIQ